MQQVSKNQSDRQRYSDTAVQPATPVVSRMPHRTIFLLAGAVLSFLFFILTDPKSISSPVLIFGFVMLGLSLYCILRLILLMTGLQTRLPKAYRRGLLLSGTLLPVLLLMLQSIGQLTLRDILTLGGLFAIGIFYIGHVGRTSLP
jgi:hypothetical protein